MIGRQSGDEYHADKDHSDDASLNDPSLGHQPLSADSEPYINTMRILRRPVLLSARGAAFALS
jgi:hypothetical protein